MNEEISAAIERAHECIDVFNRIAGYLYANPPRVDADANGVQLVPKLRIDSVPMEIRHAIDSTICAIMNVLKAAQPSVNNGVGRRPPKWWRDSVGHLSNEAHEGPRAKALLDTLLVFKPYLDENTPADLVPFILIASDKDWKLRIDFRSDGFRVSGKPHAQHTVVVFDPEIDEDIRCTLHETCGEVLSFPESCEMLLRRGLDDIEVLVE